VKDIPVMHLNWRKSILFTCRMKSESEKQGCVRGQHGRGQGQGSPRPRPQNFVLKV